MTGPSQERDPVGQDLGRIHVLDPLRGIAALSVMWFHFTNGGGLFQSPDPLSRMVKTSGAPGWAGVEAFFVISGFVLPFALQRGRYQLRHFGTFLVKRLVRLEPPYLVSLVLALALWALASQVTSFHGQPFRWEWLRLLTHLGYLNHHFGYEAYNPVYWTLGIELQFYLGLAILYPCLAHRSRSLSPVILASLLALSFLPAGKHWILHYLPFFVLGISTFQLYAKQLHPWSWGALSIISMLVSMRWHPRIGAVAALATSLAIALLADSPTLQVRWLAMPNRLLGSCGKFSYSIYLLHVLIGGKLINLGRRLAGGFLFELLLLGLAVAVTILASWLLYRFVEAPAQRLSARIKFKSSIGE